MPTPGKAGPSARHGMQRWPVSVPPPCCFCKPMGSPGHDGPADEAGLRVSGGRQGQGWVVATDGAAGRPAPCRHARSRRTPAAPTGPRAVRRAWRHRRSADATASLAIRRATSCRFSVAAILAETPCRMVSSATFWRSRSSVSRSGGLLDGDGDFAGHGFQERMSRSVKWR